MIDKVVNKQLIRHKDAYNHLNASLVQLVERRSPKPDVGGSSPPRRVYQHYVNHFFHKMELDLQPGDVVKVLESAALGWVRARVIRVKSGGRVVVQSDQGREFTARGNQVRLIEPAGFRPQK